MNALSEAINFIDADAPRGPLEELLGELVEGSSWLTHVVALDAGSGVVALGAPSLRPCVVLPGSFNPLHEGHEEMGRRAAEAAGRPSSAVLFEICVVNADKGALPLGEMRRRVEAVVARGHKVLATRASLFVEKATLCGGCDFAVGYDTYRRIVDAKYAVPPGRSLDSASQEERREWVLQALRRLDAARVRILVAGRVDGETEYRSLETHPLVELPEDLTHMILPIPGFRLDISSTELRKRAAPPSAG